MDKNMKTVEHTLWVMKTGDEYRIGLTNDIQDDLGAISFVNLPKLGETIQKNESLAELEAEKSVSELTSPLTGTVSQINTEAEANPSLLDNPDNKEAWLVVLTGVDETEFEKL
ncbi:glycine cleavage system protein H [Enterococcus canis]|nr:glycine cleavage system protein H [Enterococcus canis]